MTGVPSESPPKPETPHPKGVKQGALLVGKPEPDISAGDRRRLRGATCRDGLRASRWKCFNPRAPYGARRPPNARQSSSICFNPRAPYGARHPRSGTLAKALLFQSTRPVRGATRLRWMSGMSEIVSIHAPRTGRDIITGGSSGAPTRFNPRAPYGARRSEAARRTRALWFQSTRPVRGATAHHMYPPPDQFVSIHAPRTGRDLKQLYSQYGSWVSIHAPRTGRDTAT